MATEVLDCCKTKISPKNLDHHHFIDCFKSNKLLKQKTKNKQNIQKEIVLLALCPHCKHYILRYLWYTKKSAQFFNFDETKILRGKIADDEFIKRCNYFESYDLPNPYKNKPSMKQAKKIPWVYGKALNETTQIPRYYNESSNSGSKIITPIIATRI